ncbi:hypothetical protein D3C77_685770 [compost metagenome]
MRGMASSAAGRVLNRLLERLSQRVLANCSTKASGNSLNCMSRMNSDATWLKSALRIGRPSRRVSDRLRV